MVGCPPWKYEFRVSVLLFSSFELCLVDEWKNEVRWFGKAKWGMNLPNQCVKRFDL